MILLSTVLLPAQSNAVPGTDIGVYDVGSPAVMGRRGPAYPNGEVGAGLGHSYCNSGTVHLPWIGWVSGSSSNVMLDTYPKAAYLIARESNGRMVQISGESFLKHSRVPFNFSSGPCAPCQTGGPSQAFKIGCSDTYGTGFNGNRYNLGPTTEIDPWLGSWNPVGSYFDIGDPAVSGPAASDGIQSLTTTQTTAMDPVKNRLVISESQLTIPGTFYGQVHAMIKGEPVANRANNLMTRAISFSWNGTNWSTGFAGNNVAGSVLNQWTGATNAMGGNGSDDGRFLVAVKVTGPVNGMWHYEYAVHNLDNARGGASLRIPVCPAARVANIGFKDVDNDLLNQWTTSRDTTTGELAFAAAANNALDWNCIYNFWFDCDAAPVAGNVSIDEARIGPGNLTVDVAARAPGLLGVEYLGDGCGSPAPIAYATGVPSSPNPNFAVEWKAAPSSFVVAAFSLGGAAVDFGNGCTFFLADPVALVTVIQADSAGVAHYDIPLGAGMSPVDWYCQGFELVPAGPFLGFLAASNALKIRVAGTGCQ